MRLSTLLDPALLALVGALVCASAFHDGPAPAFGIEPAPRYAVESVRAWQSEHCVGAPVTETELALCGDAATVAARLVLDLCAELSPAECRATVDGRLFDDGGAL